MKRIIIAVALVLIFILCFSCCAKKDSTSTKAPDPTDGSNGQGECKEELIYKLSDDGTYYMLARVGNCTCGEIIIPETYKGLPVAAIGPQAFNSCQTVKKVVIPTSVKEIWTHAFNNCRNLEDINIPSGVTGIGYYAFSGCTALKSIFIPDTVTFVGGDAFRFCSELTVKCEAEDKPDEWLYSWDSSVAEVVWGYKE